MTGLADAMLTHDGSPGDERGLVIIPTYNERENIARLIETVLAQDPRLEILVVDDGSPDGTARHRRRRSWRQPPGSHPPAAAQDGARAPRTLPAFGGRSSGSYDFVFEMDADFSHDPGHLPEFLEAIQDADLVLGSRYRDGKVTVVNWPIARLILSYFANVYARARHRACRSGTRPAASSAFAEKYWNRLICRRLCRTAMPFRSR